jgi:hypothetical protein
VEAANGSFYVTLWDRHTEGHINVRDEGAMREFLEDWFQDVLPKDAHARHCIDTLEEWAQSPSFVKAPEVVAAENYLEVAAQKRLVRPSVLVTLPREPSRAGIHLITVADSEEAVQEACRVFGQDEATSCLAYIEAMDGRKAMYGVREAARREDDKLTALSVIFDGFTRTHQAAHEEHELRLQAVREARLLPPPVIKALREASATPMAVWADITGAGSTRDAELWEEGRTTPSPQSCERMWAHWHAWVRANTPLLGIPETSVETAITQPPLLLPATTPARTLTQYALMLRGQRFTLNPDAAQPERK